MHNKKIIVSKKIIYTKKLTLLKNVPYIRNMASVKINTAFNVPIQFELAGIDKRLFAWLIDVVVRLLFIYVFASILKSIFLDSNLEYEQYASRAFTILLASYTPIIFYYFILENFLNGQTIGKKLLKIRVVSLEGYKPTAMQYLVRWVMRLVDLGFFSLLFLGKLGVVFSWYGLAFIIPNIFAIVYVLRSKKEQRLGDVASGTVVIKLTKHTDLSDTIFEHLSQSYVVQYPNVLKLSDRDLQIIKTSLLNYEKSGNNTTLWLIAEKIKEVLNLNSIGDPYDLLDTIIKDYNYLSTKI